MLSFFVIVISNIAFLQLSSSMFHTIPSNLNKCKMTHLGLSYTGTISQTEGGVLCQQWSRGFGANNKVYPVASITDEMFPDYSREKAKNHCRNPNRHPKGPWCYTMDSNLINDTCGIPLCQFSTCKTTGPGMEYFGNLFRTVSGRECLKWNKKRKIKNTEGKIFEVDVYNNYLFPDNSVIKATRFCRNPTGDLAGPWCFTEDEDSKYVRKEYCAVPFCHDPFYVTMITTKQTFYTTFTEFPQKLTNLTFGVKIWDPDRTAQAEVKILLSMFAVPSSVEDVENQKSGFEVTVANGRSGMTGNNVDGNDVWEVTEGILSAEIFTYFSLAWTKNIVTLTALGQIKPQFIAEFHYKDTVIEHFKSKFKYFSLKATNMLFTLPQFDEIDDESTQECLIYTTNALDFTQFWRIQKPIGAGIQKVGGDVIFHVRAVHSVYVKLTGTEIKLIDTQWCCEDGKRVQRVSTPQAIVTASNQGLANEMGRRPKYGLISERSKPARNQLFVCMSIHFIRNTILTPPIFSAHLILATPVSDIPQLQVEMFVKSLNFHTLITFNDGNVRVILAETKIDKLLNFWEWRHFSVSIFNDEIKLFWTRDIGTNVFVQAIHPFARNLKWFSVGSDNSTALFTLGCEPKSVLHNTDAVPPSPWPPECALNDAEIDYIGTQWLTRDGVPCLPWIDSKHISQNLQFKNDDSIFDAENFCRNPIDDPNGTFCYTRTMGHVQKKYCKLRKCKSTECRMAGTGNDYIGKLNVTRSNRTCKHWINATPLLNSPEYAEYLNNTFPDVEDADAENYCRDPSKNVAGPWCYTMDPAVPVDLCNVRDCIRAEESIVLARGGGVGRYIYILPQWKQFGGTGGLKFWLKEWNPDLLDGIKFVLVPLSDETPKLRLQIGAEDNEKVTVEYEPRGQNVYEILKRVTLPHLIPAGKWTGFWLQVGAGRISLGYSDVMTPLFEWKDQTVTKQYTFDPFFLTYMSIQRNTIGVSFLFDECHVEVTKTSQFTRLMPIGIWRSHEENVHRNLTIFLRGNGTAVVPLMIMPRTGTYYALIFNSARNQVLLVISMLNGTKALMVSQYKQKVFEMNRWSRVEILFKERFLNVTLNSVNVINYDNPSIPFIFYYFIVNADGGQITWTANCNPPDIDPPARDGDWSAWNEWHCSVTCGGGNGYRERTCNNPSPNVYGKLCEGSAVETGVCNEFQCGDLSDESVNAVFDGLHKRAFNIIRDEGADVLLENANDILDKIQVESPKAFFKWTFNGIFLDPDRRKMFNNRDIHIRDALLNDTGVYVCTLYRITGDVLFLRIISLVIIPKSYNIDTRVGYRHMIKCNSVLFAYVYPQLSQRWEITGRVFRDYGVTTLAAVDVDAVEFTNKNMSGFWYCIIEQKVMGLKWITNVLKINVKNPPDFFTYLQEDPLTRGIFTRFKSSKYPFLAIILMSICLTLIGLICYLRFCRLPTQKYRHYQE